MRFWMTRTAQVVGLTLAMLSPALAQTSGSQPAEPAQAVQAEPQDTTPQSSTTPPSATTPTAPAAPEPTNAVSDAAPTTSSNPTLPHDLSPWGMFMAADIVVKGVMTALALASVATWAILLVKTIEISRAKAGLKRSIRTLAEASHLRDVREIEPAAKGAAGRMIAAAGEELLKSEPVLDLVSDQGVKERVSSRLTRIEAGAGKSIASGTGILATIGSISPFVGLFGTVWGIMNSFIGISQAQTTNLAIVAPGIAEALLATAIGLVAAIPAVVIYNYFARSISGYRVILADASAAVEQLVSRDLDLRQARRLTARPADSHRSDVAPMTRVR